MELLGDDSVLVLQDGFGVRLRSTTSFFPPFADALRKLQHTTIGSPSQCINQIASAYFVNGTVRPRLDFHFTSGLMTISIAPRGQQYAVPSRHRLRAFCGRRYRGDTRGIAVLTSTEYVVPESRS